MKRLMCALLTEFNSNIQAEIEACERLLKYAVKESERTVIEKEIAELKAVLDLMP